MTVRSSLLESLTGKFRHRNQTNILILSWSNFFQK